MQAYHWFLFGGVFLLAMVVGERWLKRSPISSAIIYLAIGLLLGPQFLNALDFDILKHPKLVEFGAEVVVIISLFSAGLKLQFPFRHSHWQLSAILATVTMISTVGLLAAAGRFLFSLPWAAAVLLAGILAPTDPVLASQIQVEDEKDKDRLRRSLTGEAGLNDGTAFPVIMLGLTMLGARWSEIENPMRRWWFVDVFWGVVVGVAIGYACGWLAARLIAFKSERNDQKLVIEDFASIGLIGASYGLAQVFSSYGFLAVFAAGVAFARVEKSVPVDGVSKETSGGLSQALIRFSTQLERIGEVTTVLFVGFIAGQLNYSGLALLLPAILILGIRPLAVFTSIGRLIPLKESLIISWFGIRGIGSIYYLSYAINHGFKDEASAVVFNLVMVTIVVSIVTHGITASPIMQFYDRSRNS